MNNKMYNHDFQYLPLKQEEIEKIHKAAMHVFEDIGFKVYEPEAFELFKKAGAMVDSDERIVRLKESTVTDIIKSTPSKVTLYGRDDKHNAYLGTGKVYLGTGGTALNVLDFNTQECRPATLRDLVDIIRITDKMKYVHIMLLPTYPNELSVEEVDVNRFFSGFMYTQKHIMGGVYTAQGIRDVIAMAERIAGSPQSLRERPFLSMITCGISPLCLDRKYGSFMMQIAREGIPLVVPVEPLCGATSPITLGGNLVIQNCDSLIYIMLTQMVNPGTPVIYGCVATSTDLRDMTYLGGPVESGLLNAASAQLSHYYGIPCYTTAGISDSKTLDAQCGYESAINNLLVAMAGADFIHDAAGLMEFALTVSKEKLVIDNEILGMALRAAKGITINDETLALDAIKKAGPGGNFVRSQHTRKNMHREHYKPQLSDRDKRKSWEQSGAQTTAERAHDIVKRFLAEPAKPHLPQSVVESLMNQFPIIEHVHQWEAVKDDYYR